MARYGGGHEGIRPGELSTMMIETPVVNLSADGNSAKGRWHILILLRPWRDSDHRGRHLRERLCARGRRVEDRAGVLLSSIYRTLRDRLDQLGRRRPADRALSFRPRHGGRSDSARDRRGAQGRHHTIRSRARIARLNDEDRIRNLQAAYGFYRGPQDVGRRDRPVREGRCRPDRRTRAFWRGVPSIRRWLEDDGPRRPQAWPASRPGPVRHHRRDRALGGNEAWARGIDLGMLGEADQEKGWWSITAFRNRFVKEAGVWKIREMRRFPVVKTDY